MHISLHDQVDRAEIERLLAVEAPWYCSLAFPTETTGPEVRQNAIRYKNGLKHIAAALPESELLSTLRAWQDDRDFWNTQQHGLVILGTPETIDVFRLPVSVPEISQVGKNWQLRPLFQYLLESGSYLLLRIDQQSLNLWLGNHFQDLTEIPLPGVPVSFEAYLESFDIHSEVQFRSGSWGAAGNQALFHGHGDVTVEEQAEMKKFFSLFDRNVKDLLNEYELPLVPVGVQEVLTLYQEANTYPHLLTPGIKHQPESLTLPELATQAWSIVRPWYKAAEERCRQKIAAVAHTDQVTHKLAVILQAAYQGKIEALFLEATGHQWGTFHPDTLQVTFHQERQPESEDLYETALAWTWKRGGEVYLETNPDPFPLTALLRYSQKGT